MQPIHGKSKIPWSGSRGSLRSEDPNKASEVGLIPPRGIIVLFTIDKFDRVKCDGRGYRETAARITECSKAIQTLFKSRQ